MDSAAIGSSSMILDNKRAPTQRGQCDKSGVYTSEGQRDVALPTSQNPVSRAKSLIGLCRGCFRFL
jgi:hypothetical protein